MALIVQQRGMGAWIKGGGKGERGSLHAEFVGRARRGADAQNANRANGT
jgi:hypothetical protein